MLKPESFFIEFVKWMLVVEEGMFSKKIISVGCVQEFKIINKPIKYFHIALKVILDKCNFSNDIRDNLKIHRNLKSTR